MAVADGHKATAAGDACRTVAVQLAWMKAVTVSAAARSDLSIRTP